MSEDIAKFNAANAALRSVEGVGSRCDMENRTVTLRAGDDEAARKALDALAAAGFYGTSDNPNLTIMEIRAKARRLKSRIGDLGMIVIDYLQLMTGQSRAENRQVEVSELSRGLKILARELETPVVALSQLSRGLEMRSDKRPMLADLRESGSIEQDADVVMFIYREEMYMRRDEWEALHPDREREPYPAGKAQIIVAKHRHGETGKVDLIWSGATTSFRSRSTQEPEGAEPF